MRGDGSIYLRGETYWMQFYRDGRAVRMSCKTTSPEKARNKLRAELRKSDAEFLEPKFKRITIEELYDAAVKSYEARGLDEYAKNARARWNNHLKDFFGHMKAASLGTTQQDAYRLKRKKEGASSATMDREILLLAQAFKLGYEAVPPLVKRKPKFRIYSEPNARRVFATPEQVEALKTAAAKYPEYGFRIRVLLEIAVTFGWRRGDVLFLQAKNIHLAENTIRLEDSKNGDAREAPMPPTLRTLITALVSGMSPEDRLWPYSETCFFHCWDDIRKEVGCPDLRFHDLRRTSARTKRAAGVDPTIIMELQGWRTMNMFKRYGIVDIADKVAALAKQEVYEREQAQNRHSEPKIVLN